MNTYHVFFSFKEERLNHEENLIKYENGQNELLINQFIKRPVSKQQFSNLSVKTLHDLYSHIHIL